MVEQVKVFLSYSHRDKELKEHFVSHFYSLVRTENVGLWTDDALLGGQTWNKEIQEQLDNADLVILLISSWFLKSEYCCSIELQAALKNRKERKAVIVPVMLSNCSLTNTPLAEIQTLPVDPRFVEDWKNRNDAFVDVIEGLRKTIRTTVIELKKWDPIARKKHIIDLAMAPDKLEDACNATIDLAVIHGDEFYVFRALTLRTTLSEINQEKGSKELSEILNAKQNLRIAIFRLVTEIVNALKKAI